MLPTSRTATDSSFGSTTAKVGTASFGCFTRKGPFFSSSMLMASQTNCPARLVREESGKTNSLIERQVCHQGAQASMKSGSVRARASASAFG
jgi:hypothetical protein